MGLWTWKDKNGCLSIVKLCVLSGIYVFIKPKCHRSAFPFCSVFFCWPLFAFMDPKRLLNYRTSQMFQWFWLNYHIGLESYSVKFKFHWMCWLSRFFDTSVPDLVIKKLLDCYPIAQNTQSMVLFLGDTLSNSGECCLQELSWRFRVELHISAISLVLAIVILPLFVVFVLGFQSFDREIYKSYREFLN